MLNTIPAQLEDGWPIASLEQAHLDPAAIARLTQWLQETYEYQNTHAVLIEHAGYLVYEAYLEGPDQSFYGPREHRVFDVDALHDLQSVSKSITALLLGIAFRGEYTQALASTLSEFFKNSGLRFGPGAEAVTLHHLLTMTAGFEWDTRTHPYGDPRNDNHQMYDLVKDPVALILGRAVTHPPGSHFQYNNALTEVIAAIIEQKTGQRIDRFAAQALFAPLGITRFEWRGPPAWRPTGRPSAAGGLRLRARDLARIGSLFLHQGLWEDQQIVPQDWIALCARNHVERSMQGSRGVYGYGYQWWPGFSNSIPRYSIIAGFGNGGQQLLIVPERHLVVTIFAGNYGRYRHDLFNWMLDRIAFAHRQHN